MTTLTAESLLALTAEERSEVLKGLDPQVMAQLLYDWDFWARPSQREPEGDWRIWMAMSGRGWGKTRVGAEWVRKSVKDFEFVNIGGATADDARDIMIEGESGIMAVCPDWERPEYRRTLRRLDWPNGARTLIFTADEPERFRGKQHQRFWADEVAAWRYPESWEQMILGLRLPPDPRALMTTTPKPIRLIIEMLEDPSVVITKGSSKENRDNLDPAWYAQLVSKYEGTRMGRQELDAELLLDEGLAYEFSEHLHVIRSFPVPDFWPRFECMDYGQSAPTAWYAVAVDEHRNLVVFDEYYAPGLPSFTSAEILERRKRWHPRGAPVPVTFADPAVYNDGQTTNRWGRPARVADEFLEAGIALRRGNNDRRAGYVRVAELLKLQPRSRPGWAGLPEAETSPSLFVFDRCVNLIDQLRYAPVDEEDEPFPGEAVSRKWETSHGHGHAALRYGMLSWPSAGVRPVEEPADPRVALMLKVERKRELEGSRSRYTQIV